MLPSSGALNLLSSAYDSSDDDTVMVDGQNAMENKVEDDVRLTMATMMNLVLENEDQLSKCVKTEVPKDASVEFTNFRTTRNEDEINVSSESSSSSDSDSEAEDVHEILEKEDLDEVVAKVILKTKGELDLDDLPPIENLHILANTDDLVHVGRVVNIMDRLVSVLSFKGMPPLELDSVLFLKDGLPLGSIFEVFGPVVEPRYLVRFNTGDDIVGRQIMLDMPVYYAASFDAPTTAFVFMEHLRKLKGTDASWKHNNEPPEELKEYSDDEEERRDKMKQKAKRKGSNQGNNCNSGMSTPSPRSLSGYASPSSLIAPPNTPMNSYYESKFHENYHRAASASNWFSTPRGRKKK